MNSSHSRNGTNSTQGTLDGGIWVYIEVSYSFLAAAVGIPFNLYIFARLIKQIIHGKHNRLTLLSLQINVADIMIIFFKCIIYSIWQLVGWWELGDVSCRLYQFLLLFCFYVASNSKVSLALDMYQSIHFPMSIRITGNRYARIYIAASWIIGAIAAVPQLFFFTADKIPIPPYRHQCYSKFALSPTLYGINGEIYDVYHQLMVFWFPLLLIIILYSSIVVEGYKALNRGMSMKLGKDKSEQNNAGTSKCCICCTKHSKAQDEPLTDTPLLSAGTNRLEPLPPEDAAVGANRLARQNSSRKQLATQQLDALHRARNQKCKILKFSLSIIAAYIICWSPYQVKSLLEWRAPESRKLYIDKYFHWLAAVMIFNSCINPLLYGFGQTGNSHSRRRPTDVPTEPTVVPQSAKRTRVSGP